MSASAENKSVEQIILDIAMEIFAAIQRKDIHSFSRFLAEEFVYRTPAGSELGREEFLQNVAAMPVEIIGVRGEQQRVSVFGEVAVLTGVQRAEWRQGDEARGVSAVAFTDVFAHRGGRWLMVLAYGVELQA